MKTYYGTRDTRGYVGVVVCEGYANPALSRAMKLRPLDPRHDLANHSPDGFEWGYPGSGPSQLALALLADALGDDARALALYPDFKRSFVALLDAAAPWSITDAAIAARCHELESERAR